MASPAQHASSYLDRGWCPIPVPYGKKGPTLKGWPDLRLQPHEVDRQFRDKMNIGVLLGEPSGNLVDIDLDCGEACVLAPDLLPPTPAVFGRASKPASHWLYVAELNSLKFLDPVDNSILLEVRSTGLQTVFPGSVHPTGELIEWQTDGLAAGVAPSLLLQAVRQLAAAAILARHWPAQGGRHQAQLTLSSCLVRSGWDVPRIARFVAGVSRAAGGEADLNKRLATARDAADRMATGRPLQGFPSLQEMLGPVVANRVSEWLELKQPHAGVPATAVPNVVAGTQFAPLRNNSDVEIARRVEKQLEEQFGEFVRSEGRFWHHHGTHWAAMNDHHVRITVHAVDGCTIEGKASRVSLNKHRIDSIIHELAVIRGRSGFFDDASIGINCASGFIKFREDGTSLLTPHSRDHRVRYVLRGRWPTEPSETDVKASLLHRLLCGVFCGDRDAQAKINLIGEVLASAALGLATSLVQPCAVVLHGATAENGKSQILDLMRGFIPQEVVAAVPPHKLSDEKHLVQLAGRLLNACDEMSPGAAISADIFKQVVTGDPISARDVYRSAVSFRCRAQHVLATNVLPAFTGGMDRGVRRRLLVVGFNRTIPLEERMPGIGRRVAHHEQDLVLDWTVQAATRLKRQKAFTCPPSSVEALREWFLGSDPVLAWAEEAIVVDDQAQPVPTSDAYRHFRAWATHEGFADHRLPAVAAFSQRLVAAGLGIGTKRSGQRRYLIGFRLRALPVSLRASAGNSR